MKFVIFILAGLFLFSPQVFGQKEIQDGKATLTNAKGEKVGSATFVWGAKGMYISVSVENLSPGKHGLHIHEIGKCEPPDFKSAGVHFNPHSRQHGHKNPQGAHAGDFPNLIVKKNGKGQLTNYLTESVTPWANEPNSIFKAGGTSLVIHADPDDEKTDPAGNSGARIACGVIEK